MEPPSPVPPSPLPNVMHNQHYPATVYPLPPMSCSGKRVYAENFGKGACWLPGIVNEANGPVSFTVELEDGRIIRRHSDHLRTRTDIPRKEEQDFCDDLPQLDPDKPPEPPPLAGNSTQESIPSDSTPNLRRSTRIRRPPNRYEPGLH